MAEESVRDEELEAGREDTLTPEEFQVSSLSPSFPLGTDKQRAIIE